MKKLFLVRHAKSGSKSIGMNDFDRPLNERGMADAPMMGERLKLRGAAVDLIVCSPALRARQTAELIAAALSIDAGEIVEEAAIYEAWVEDLDRVVRGFDDGCGSVMLVGHNPGLTEFLAALCSCGGFDLSTAAVAEVELDIESWSRPAAGAGRLCSFDYP